MFLLLLITFSCLFNLNELNAQNNGYSTSSASANLVLPLSIEAGNGDLDFGEIILTGSSFQKTIIPKNGKEFIITGQPRRAVTVIFDNVELNNLAWLSKNHGKAGNLIFYPNLLLDNSVQVNSGGNLTLRLNGLAGEIKLNVGGSIKINSEQPIGNYEGLFIISVTY